MESSRKAEAADPGAALAACLSRHLPAGGHIAVGYSGGLDSTVLLHALASLPGLDRTVLSAVHVHHGLSPRADTWAAHCQAFCDELGIVFVQSRVRVQLQGTGLEAAARQARYDVFRQLAVDALLLAHHLDDQAETVMLQMLRGASVRGMAAMPEVRPLKPGTLLLRPLLSLTRGDLEAYARRHGLSWVEDESNRDPGLARNRVRHVLLPGLETAMPGLPGALARAAYQFAEWADLLDELAHIDEKGHSDNDGLSLARLKALSEPRARNLLRRYVERAGGRVGRQALMEAVRQLRCAAGSAQVRIDFGDLSVVRFRGRVRTVPLAAFAAVPPLDQIWRGEGQADLGSGGQLTFCPGKGEVLLPLGARLRHRQPGDRMRPGPHQPLRPLKDLLREAGVPSWRRPWLPVFEVDGQVAWVAELGPAAEFRGSGGWAISWAPPW